MAELIVRGEQGSRDEVTAATVLKADLPANWTIICNTTLPDASSGMRWEIDQIVIAPRYIFVIDVKRIAPGLMGNADYWWVQGKEPYSSPLRKAHRIAGLIRSRLRTKVLNYADKGKFFVTGLVLLIDRIDLHYLDDALKGARIVFLDEACRRLQDMETNAACDFLEGRSEDVVEYLKGLPTPPIVPSELGEYVNVKRLGSAAEYYLAKGEYCLLLGTAEAERYLRIWPLGEMPGSDERERLERLIMKEWHALDALQGAHCVTKVEKPFHSKDGNLLVVPFGIPPGDSLRALQVRSGGIRARQVARIMSVVLRQLAAS